MKESKLDMSKRTCFIRCISLSIILMVLSGCAGSDIGERAVYEDDTCLVRVQIKVPTGGNITRSGGYSDTHIETIDILSFRQDDNTFQYRASARVIDTQSKWFDVVLNKSRDEVQKLVVLANLKEELDNFSLIEGTTTIDNLRKSLTIAFNHQTVYDPTHTTTIPGQLGKDRPLPMWGESEPVAILSEEMNLGTIYMLRSVAAVTVVINLDTSDPDQKPFQLVDVVITNTPDKGLVIPDPSIVTTASDGYKTVSEPTTGNLTPTYSNAYYSSTDGVSIPYGIYTGEYNNTNGVAEEDRTWLLIGGIYDNSGVVTWYRLPWIDREGKQWDVLCNHNYIFNITKVTGAGNTEEDAKDNDIYADVIPWNLGTDGVFDIDGIYWISIDPSVASYGVTGGSGTINVETNYPDGWTATVSESETDRSVPCTWLTIDPASTGSQLKYSVAQTDQWTDRSGYLHITSGGFAVTVRINQSRLYISDTNVTPAGNISGDGEDRTVRILGLFDDIRIRVWDKTNDQEILQNPANPVVPGNIIDGNPGSVVVSIPAWSGSVNRIVAIQYYDKVQNDWISIQEATQEGYNFTVASNLINGNAITTGGGSYTITVAGTAWPTVYVRGVVRGTDMVVTNTVTVTAGNGTTTQSLTVNAYEQWSDPAFARTVELQWSKDNSDWSGATAINYGIQSGSYNVTSTTFTLEEVKLGDGKTLRLLLVAGGTISTSVLGSFKDSWVQVRVARNEDKVTAVSSSYTTSASQTVNIQVNSNYNYEGDAHYQFDLKGNPFVAPQQGGIRDVICQYRRFINGVSGNTADGEWETTWTNFIMDPVRQLGYVTLATGRVVALEDCKAGGNTGAESMNWATAMGITSNWNTTIYPESNANSVPAVLAYSTNYNSSNGGCAAYKESQTSNSFYLPTQLEIDEISERYRAYYEIGAITWNSPWYYWANWQTTDPATRVFTKDIEMGTGGVATNKTASYRARCVRAK